VYKKGLKKLCTALYPGCHVLCIYFEEKFLFNKRFIIVSFLFPADSIRQSDLMGSDRNPTRLHKDPVGIRVVDRHSDP
jgi:hypothetical protein